MGTNYLEKRTPQERLIIAKTLLETVLDDMRFAQNVQLSEEDATKDATSDLIRRVDAVDIGRRATVDTNPSHFDSHQKFEQFMDDVEISSFGRWEWANGFNTALTAISIDLKQLPSAEPEIIRCKDCKHFEYDHIENVNGIPLIVAHEICMRWCEGTKTSENGYCFLAERKEE